ncbi:hypothetical protein BJY04DRAFT_180058 [Aspergillus karnatakaensis]|uniref:uncharacterized protein n=1 Tax=Aspergillus karnatakaensis TaxID=1810916 RepID=UPI003CCDFCE1
MGMVEVAGMDMAGGWMLRRRLGVGFIPGRNSQDLRVLRFGEENNPGYCIVVLGVCLWLVIHWVFLLLVGIRFTGGEFGVGLYYNCVSTVGHR